MAHMELLVHTAAPTTKSFDDKVREQGAAYHEFRPAIRHNLHVTQRGRSGSADPDNSILWKSRFKNHHVADIPPSTLEVTDCGPTDRAGTQKPAGDSPVASNLANDGLESTPTQIKVRSTVIQPIRHTHILKEPQDFVRHARIQTPSASRSALSSKRPKLSLESTADDFRSFISDTQRMVNTPLALQALESQVSMYSFDNNGDSSVESDRSIFVKRRKMDRRYSLEASEPKKLETSDLMGARKSNDCHPRQVLNPSPRSRHRACHESSSLRSHDQNCRHPRSEANDPCRSLQVQSFVSMERLNQRLGKNEDAHTASFQDSLEQISSLLPTSYGLSFTERGKLGATEIAEPICTMSVDSPMSHDSPSSPTMAKPPHGDFFMPVRRKYFGFSQPTLHVTCCTHLSGGRPGLHRIRPLAIPSATSGDVWPSSAPLLRSDEKHPTFTTLDPTVMNGLRDFPSQIFPKQLGFEISDDESISKLPSKPWLTFAGIVAKMTSVERSLTYRGFTYRARDPEERGYWHIDLREWTFVDRLSFLQNIKEFMVEPLVGVRLWADIKKGIDGLPKSVDIFSEAKDARHIYWVLYVLSEDCVGIQSTRWIDSSGMPAIEFGKKRTRSTL